MNNLKNYQNYVEFLNESFGETAARVITGDSVGWDPKKGMKYPLTSLGEKNFKKIVDAWDGGDGLTAAAEELRAIIIREKDMQLKYGITAIMLGISLYSLGKETMEEVVKIEPGGPGPPPEKPPVPDGIVPPGGGGVSEIVGINKGDGLIDLWNNGADAAGIDFHFDGKTTLGELNNYVNNHVDGKWDAVTKMFSNNDPSVVKELQSAIELNSGKPAMGYFTGKNVGSGPGGFENWVTQLNMKLTFTK